MLLHKLLIAGLMMVFTHIGLVQASDDEWDDLWGDDLDTSQASASGFALTELSGYSEISLRSFLRDRNAYANDEQVLISTELELDLGLANSLTAYLRPRLFLDASDNSLQRYEWFEAYLTYAQNDWDLRIGQFVENWGIADTFNPVDVLNRRDQSTQMLDTTRLGEAGIRTRWLFEGNETVGEPTLSLYIIPSFQRTRFAPDGQRLGLGSEAVTFRETGGFEPKGSEEAFYALRYQSTYNTSWFNADLQLLAARGADRNPLIRAEDDQTLVPVYYGNRIIGAGIRAVPNDGALSGATLKLEVAHNRPYRFDRTSFALPEDYFAYVVGFDLDDYNVLNAQDQLTLTLEYAGESGVTSEDAMVFSRPFSKDVITRVFWQAGDFARSSLEFRALHDLDNHEQVLEATYARSLLALHEDLKMELSALYVKPSSAEGASFSQLPDNTSIALTLRYDF